MTPTALAIFAVGMVVGMSESAAIQFGAPSVVGAAYYATGFQGFVSCSRRTPFTWVCGVQACPVLGSVVQ